MNLPRSESLTTLSIVSPAKVLIFLLLAGALSVVEAGPGGRSGGMGGGMGSRQGGGMGSQDYQHGQQRQEMRQKKQEMKQSRQRQENQIRERVQE